MRCQVLICLLCLLLQQVAGVLWGDFELPPTFSNHLVKGSVRLFDEKTIQLENFDFDGGGREVLVYYYRPGDPVLSSGGGFTIPVPEPFGGAQNAGFNIGTRLTDATIRLTMPEGTTVCDIATLTIWCAPFRVIFNRVTLTREFFVNNGDAPCTVRPEFVEEIPTEPVPIPPLNNCMFLDPSLQLRWAVDRARSNVIFELCGCLSSSPEVDQYMAFGVSGSDDFTLMLEADPTITWIGTDSMPNAVDYHLSAYTQCVTDQGACPDSVYENCTNDAVLISGLRNSNQQCVTFTRPFMPSDVGTCDRPLDPDNPNQYIVWGVGALGDVAFRHFLRAQASDAPVHLGRTPVDECGNRPLACQVCPPYQNEVLVARDNATFTAVIGPSGDQRGYLSITGLPSWGIAWYINGSLIPEVVVQRGSTYTFIVEGGDDPAMESQYHPFYITSSSQGSRLSETNQDIRNSEVVYAGFSEQDQVTAVGRLCELRESPGALASRTSCQSLGDYVTRLEEGSGCSQGEPGTLTWTPDENTPDVVYYQCATHKNLGWRIHVLNENDTVPTFTPRPTVTTETDPPFGGAPPTHSVTVLSVLLCVGVALMLAALN